MSNIIGWQYRILLDGAGSFVETVPVPNNTQAKVILENKYPQAKQIIPIGPVKD